MEAFAILGHGQRPTPESCPWQCSPLHSDLPEDLTPLLKPQVFFFTLKYLAILPCTEEILVDQEKTFLGGKARVGAGNPNTGLRNL